MDEAQVSSEAARGKTATARNGRPRPEQPRRSTVVASDGTRLSVFESGSPDKPTVLLVHGFPDDHSGWDGLVALLAPDYHVVTLDTRGSGSSDRPKPVSAYRLDQMAADLRAVIDATAPGRPVHLVGHDWGSIQSWHLVTSADPHGIVSYTSVSGGCIDHLPAWGRARLAEGPKGWRKLLAMWKSPIYMSAFQIPVLAPLACRLGLVDATIGVAARVFEVGQKPSGPQGRARNNFHALKLYTANLFPRLRRPQQRGTDIPVQIVSPRRDIFVPASAQADPDPSVTRHRIELVDGGHWATSYNPGPIAALVADWASQHQPKH